jgi:glutamate/tyrosine decarboxylase-like PLP-dependent enzyme
LSAFGVGAFREGIDRNLDLVEIVQHIVEEDPDLEPMNAANLGIVCFRRRIAELSEVRTARVNSWLIAALEATGRALISSTRLHGRYTLRICVLNHLTQESDIRWTLEFLARTQIPEAVLGESDSSAASEEAALMSLLSRQGRRELTDRSFRRQRLWVRSHGRRCCGL